MKRASLRLVTPEARSDDADHVARSARGDVGALGALYDAHANALLRFVSRLVGDDEAEDVVQETFLRVSRAAAGYDARQASARPWLFGIAVNVVKERKRAFARLARALGRLRDHAVDASTGVEAPSSDVDRALARLSEAKRAVLVLAELEGFSGDEIARMLDVPVGTVWTRLHHARRELREFLGEAR